MPATSRCCPPTLMQTLVKQPQRFQLVQAVRIIDRWLKSDCDDGRTLEQVLRFKNSVSLAYPPSEIEAVQLEGNIQHFHITATIMGLLGTCGALPYCYTDAIAAPIHARNDESGRAFLDSFIHRSITLFYRAWEKCHIEYRSGTKDQSGPMSIQLALSGAGVLPQQQQNGLLNEAAIARYCALIRHRPVSAETIVGILADYFKLPFDLEPFVPTWIPLQPSERSQLGIQNRELGVNAMLGPRYVRRHLKARLWVGPLCRTDCELFLPTASGARALREVLTLLAMPNQCFQIRPILRAKDVLPTRLNGRARLGQDAMLLTRRPTSDNAHMKYEIAF